MNTLRRPLLLLALAAAAAMLPGCATRDRDHRILVSVPDQQMVVLHNGDPVARYPISTSKFGIGDEPGSNATPPGRMEVARKIGSGLPAGSVLKDRKPTGEILPPNAPGRDPIVTRILWLRGLESANRNAFPRYIYIHGTPEERTLGTPASYGCIRMRSQDVVELFDRVGTGATVEVRPEPLSALVPTPSNTGG